MAQMVKNLPTMQENWVRSLGREVPWRREWQPTPVFLPGESPWTEPDGRQYMRSQSDMTEQLTRSLSSRKALGDSTISGIPLFHSSPWRPRWLAPSEVPCERRTTIFWFNEKITLNDQNNIR